MMFRAPLPGYFTTRSVCVSIWLETITFSSRTLDSRDSLRDCLSSTSSMVLALSGHELSGASRCLQQEPAQSDWEAKQEGKPALPPSTRTSLGAGYSREPLRQLRGAWNCIHHQYSPVFWDGRSRILHGYPFHELCRKKAKQSLRTHTQEVMAEGVKGDFTAAC